MGCVFKYRHNVDKKKLIMRKYNNDKMEFTASNGFTRQTFRSGPSKDCEDLCNECSKTRK